MPQKVQSDNNRRKRLYLLRYFCATLFSFLALAGCNKEKEAERPVSLHKPNIVLILIDALRAKNLSSYGYERNTSPNIDSLAEKSLVFKKAYTVAASTPPSLAAIMTGRLPFYVRGSTWNERTVHGLRRFYQNDEKRGLPHSIDTLAEILQRNGYNTGGIITNPYVKSTFHFDKGFDFYEELFNEGLIPYGLGEEVTDNALGWLRAQSDTPFFLYLHYMDVHGPYLPPKIYRSLFQFAKVPDHEDHKLFETWSDEKDLGAPEYRNLKEHMLGLYDASIYYTDVCVGKILSYLQDNQLMEETVVVILADHGEEFLEHGGTTHKGTMYDELMHIPLIVHIPRQGHKEVQSQVRTFDIMPTLLDYAGIPYDSSQLDAVSLRQLIQGKEDSLQLPLFANFPTMGKRHRHRQLLQSKNLKLIHDVGNPEKSEVYNLSEDPNELKNAYNKNSNAVKQLDNQLNKIVSKLNSEVLDYAPLKRTALALNAVQGFQGIRTNSQVEGKVMPDRYVAKAMGQDPIVILPAFPFSPAVVNSVRIDMASPAETIFQLFYKTADRPMYTEECSIEHQIKKGRNIFDITITDETLTGQLRLDPGRKKGIYEFFSIEVTQVKRSDTVKRPIKPAGAGPRQSGKSRQSQKTRTKPDTRGKDTNIDEETLRQLRQLGYTK